MQGGNQPADISRINRRDLLVSLSPKNQKDQEKMKEKTMVLF